MSVKLMNEGKRWHIWWYLKDALMMEGTLYGERKKLLKIKVNAQLKIE
jgi:hypothetical protein